MEIPVNELIFFIGELSIENRLLKAENGQFKNLNKELGEALDKVLVAAAGNEEEAANEPD